METEPQNQKLLREIARKKAANAPKIQLAKKGLRKGRLVLDEGRALWSELQKRNDARVAIVKGLQSPPDPTIPIDHVSLQQTSERLVSFFFFFSGLLFNTGMMKN